MQWFVSLCFENTIKDPVVRGFLPSRTPVKQSHIKTVTINKTLLDIQRIVYFEGVINLDDEFPL